MYLELPKLFSSAFYELNLITLNYTDPKALHIEFCSHTLIYTYIKKWSYLAILYGN